MKLVIAVVQGKDAEPLLGALTNKRYRATQVNSAGGFLRESNVTLLIGVEETSVAEVLSLIEENCHSRTRFVNPLMPIMEPGEFYVPNPVEVLVGGATVFVLAVSRYERVG
ncbi:MAG: cyclic-di-AMP receptor [Chloroflexia bacterium]|nr:cyclic-di-AMP receptor [Chloroflexia bacterium]